MSSILKNKTPREVVREHGYVPSGDSSPASAVYVYECPTRPNSYLMISGNMADGYDWGHFTGPKDDPQIQQAGTDAWKLHKYLQKFHDETPEQEPIEEGDLQRCKSCKRMAVLDPQSYCYQC